MEVKAQAKLTRIAPKKVRLIVDFITGKSVSAVRDQLKVSTKKAAPIVLKILNSAVSNAKNNKKANEDDLIISKAFVDQGPTLKRWRARAFGRAAQIRKRTSKITIFVSDKK